MNRQVEGHTVQRFDAELSGLYLKVLEMGGLAMSQLEDALDALRNKDLPKARAVIARDSEVDSLEVRADDAIVEVIARRGPVARDLRTIMGFSKAVTDLERVGDEAARIAGVALHIYDSGSSDPSVHLLRDVYTMGKLALGMLRAALEVFDRMDAEGAERVAEGQTEMDAEFRSSVRRLATYVMEDSRNVGHAVSVVLIIKALERVGDHARNIAEYVIYLVKGTDVRHRPSVAPEARAEGGGV